MELFFYFFSTLIILSAIGVILLKNPVHAVMCLILSFINTAGIFIIIGADFIAFMLIIIYVGAVIIMFLFVVMMADFKITPVFKGIGFIEGILITSSIVVFIVCMLLVLGIYEFNNEFLYSSFTARDIAQVLYTDHFLILELSGFILLIAMVGTIVLVLSKNSEVKRQKLFKQLAKPNRAKLCSVESYKGLNYDL